MNLRIEKKYIGFVFLYFFTILFLLLDCLDNIPFITVLRKFKYVYMLIMAVWFFFTLKNPAAKDRIRRKSNIVMLLCLAHTVFFGYIFTNQIVVSYTYIHARELLIYYVLVYLTLTYIYENRLLLTYTVSTYIALVFQLFWALITHLGEFVNPLTYWRAFSNSLRYRSDFGFVQFGYTANYCVFALVASLLIFDILLKERKLKENFKLMLIMLFCDVVIACILFSTAGRSGILSIILIIGIYFLASWIMRMNLQNRRIAKTFIIIGLIAFVIVVFFSGFFSSIWEDSNRDLNITVNYPVFQKLGNIWTGMGFVENSAFQVGANNNWTSIFGERTSSLDIYYLYLYFTTGIIGCILIGGALLYLLYKMARGVRYQYGAFGLSLIIGWLFYAYWQCNMLTYRYYSPWFYLVVLLYILDNFKNSKELEYSNNECSQK